MCAVRVWAYVCTSETTTTITVTCGSVTSTSSSWLLETWWHHSRAGQGLSSFWRWPHREKRVSRVCFRCWHLPFLGTPPRSELPGWPWSCTCHLPAPHPHLGPGVTCALFSSQVERHSLKDPEPLKGKIPRPTVMSGYILIAPSIKSTVSKELFLILLT